ncbi:MAG TPA: replication initiator [bacterium]|nr:replication initiator [bacterium]
MGEQAANLDDGRASVIARGCVRPFKTKTGVWVRCGSRVKSACESCAELYRGDWAAIARSGVFDGPVQDFRFYLLTLTAPSFGPVHRVPREGGARAAKCGCGLVHDAVGGAGLRGVPLDAVSYDYDGQAAWNRDAGLLWDRTRRRLRDRWDSLEYFIVREWQERGVLHVHAIVRVARFEAPEPSQLQDAARTATAFSKVDGCLVAWGAQARCDAFTADGDGAKTIWYLSKALNYVMKDVALVGQSPHSAVLSHQARLAAAARRMRCSRECVPANCPAKLHDRYGARSQVVSASRRTKHRTGWSFSGLTRTVQRQLRLAWFLAKNSEASTEPEATMSAAEVVGAQEGRAARLRLELASLAASGP